MNIKLTKENLRNYESFDWNRGSARSYAVLGKVCAGLKCGGLAN